MSILTPDHRPPSPLPAQQPMSLPSTPADPSPGVGGFSAPSGGCLCCPASIPIPPSPAGSSSSGPARSRAGADGSASLDPLETSSPLTPAEGPPADALDALLRLQTRWQRLVHRPHRQDRDATMKALWAADTDPDLDPAQVEDLQRQALRIANCCSYTRITANAEGRVYLQGTPCKQRMCARCASARAKRGAERCLAATQAMDSIRFITLTLDHRPAPLGVELDRLLAAFRRLRKDPRWARRVRGGIYAVEAHPSADGVGWHVHLHALADGEYLPQQDLAAAWTEATATARIVDIRLCPSRSRAAGYVTKYASKPPSSGRWGPARLREYATAMKGRRLLSAFGSLHGASVDPPEPNHKDPLPTATIPSHALRAALTARHPAAIAFATAIGPHAPAIWRCLTDDGTHPALRNAPDTYTPGRCLPDLLAAIPAAQVVQGTCHPPPLPQTGKQPRPMPLLFDPREPTANDLQGPPFPRGALRGVIGGGGGGAAQPPGDRPTIAPEPR